MYMSVAKACGKQRLSVGAGDTGLGVIGHDLSAPFL